MEKSKKILVIIITIIVVLLIIKVLFSLQKNRNKERTGSGNTAE